MPNSTWLSFRSLKHKSSMHFFFVNWKELTRPTDPPGQPRVGLSGESKNDKSFPKEHGLKLLMVKDDLAEKEAVVLVQD